MPSEAVVKDSLTTAIDGKKYKTKFYNLDVIISVGYRVKSKRGTQFRQWATQKLKDYLMKGYALNEHRLAQKNQEIQFLHDGIRIMSRAIEEVTNDEAYYFYLRMELLLLAMMHWQVLPYSLLRVNLKKWKW